MMTGLFGYIVFNLMRIIYEVCVAFVQFNIYAEIIFLGSLLFIIYSYVSVSSCQLHTGNNIMDCLGWYILRANYEECLRFAAAAAVRSL